MLKPYVVREDRVIEFKERDMLTSKGALDLARRRYAHLGPATDAALLRRLAEDFKQERRQEVVEMKGLLDLGGIKLPPEVERKIHEASRPPSEFSIPFGEPFRPLR